MIRFGACILALVLITSYRPFYAYSCSAQQRWREDGKRLFARETFGGNGRTCLTC
jgi:hypothetical protein